eukprot:SAG22_NODE_469_length_10143_cov_5.595181_2_plen_487_part_00
MAECPGNKSLGVAGRPGEWYSFVPAAANIVHEVRLLAEDRGDDVAFSSSIVPDILDGNGDRVPTSVPPTMHSRAGASVLRWNTTNAGSGPFFVRATAAAQHSMAVAAVAAYRVDSMIVGDQGTWDDTTAVFLSIDVGVMVRVSMPFTFKFYGVEYDQLWVSSSGYISFEEQGSGGFADVGSVHTAVVACGGVFKPSMEDGAAVTVTQSETELQVRWRGALFNSSQLSDVSLSLRHNGSVSIKWPALHLSSGGSLESGLAAWLLSDDLSQNSSFGAGDQIPNLTGDGATGTLVVGAGASVRTVRVDASRYFSTSATVQHYLANGTTVAAAVSGFTLIRSNVECNSGDSRLCDGGLCHLDTVTQCADLCRSTDDCEFFIYGNKDGPQGNKAGLCYYEFTASASCDEGFEADSYEFYQLNHGAFPQPALELALVEASASQSTAVTQKATLFIYGAKYLTRLVRACRYYVFETGRCSLRSEHLCEPNQLN